MRNDTRRDITDILARRRKHHTWQKLVSVLSCIVVFCVTYALILPAITLEKTPNCGKQEHVHTAECYQTAGVLTCQLEAHTHSEACFDAPQITPLSERTTTPLPLYSEAKNYISGAVLSYRTDPNADWQEVTASTTLPGDADLKLEISYKDIHVDTLKNAGYQVTYTLPSILRDPTGTGQILDSNQEPMGTMTVENSVVTLTFDQTWLDTHHGSEGNKIISGKFHVESDINLTEASQNPTTQITVGNVTIDLKFESEIIAKHADVTIQKSTPRAIHNEHGDYLEYTLTVTAGQDGAPNVVVKDLFDASSQSQIAGYVGISADTPAVSGVAGPVETGAPAGKAGTFAINGNTMEWTVGDMAANETRTLTYRVKVADGYLGGAVPMDPGENPNSSEDDTPIPIINTATPFCGGHDRDPADSTFTPKAEATMSKIAGDFTPDPNGSGGTITYTIWIHAYDTNNYTLTDVKIWDALDGSLRGNNPNPTEDKYLPYLSFVENSFHLYKDGSEKQNGAAGLTPIAGSPTNPDYPNGPTNKHFFTYDVGTLAPGESKTLTYTVKVGPEVFAAAGNNTPKVNNRAQVHAGDSEKGNETALNSYNSTKEITRKEWSSKTSGTKQDTATAVPLSGKVYTCAANGSLTETTLPNLAEFTAPAGSYKYTVTINKTGDWDVSGLSMTDQLSGYSKYIGYVRVDAYNVDGSDKRTLADTVWLSVDGKTSFSFKPSSVDWTGVQSYDLTYYTQVDIGNASMVTVENTFTMTGKVGIGNLEYNSFGATVTASNVIQGSNSFSVSKHSWYYEPPKVTTGHYANGAFYWYIQVDGNVVPANTHLKDITSWNTQYMYEDSSLVGLYTGKLGDDSISAYDDLEDLLASNKLTALEKSKYNVEIAGTEGRFPTMTVQITSSVPLDDGKSLFMIVKIEPHKNPASMSSTDCSYYYNAVQSSYNGENWVKWGNAKIMALHGSNGISKTLEKVSSWNGTTETVVTQADETATPAALTGLQESGTYVSWSVQLNRTGRLHGSYCVEELIPDGLELAYVECTGVGGGYTDAAKPSCAQKTLDGWTKHERAGELTTYYYTSGQTARWYVDGLQTDADPTNQATYTMDFRVVCRVTDADVLLGGETKEFQNKVRLLREGGKEIDSSNSAVALQSHTLSKNGTYNSEENATRVPFEVTLNPLGEDLVSGEETIALVDTLGDTLKLDLSSIRVTETGTNNQVTGWESSVKGQTLTLTLPDQKALTVTYSAWINAKPGDRISISNNAHWEGRSTTSGGAWSMQNFEFNVSASAGTAESPSIEITKLDENHTSTALPGAKFTLTKAVASGEQITETNEIKWEGTTDTYGKLSFGVASDQTMEYNTIYCLKETQAPAGYVLDNTPYYFVIAKADKNGDYPSFPENVYVHYTGSKYSYQALNHRGQITVEKKFTDPGGNAYGPVVGTYTFGLYDTPDGSGTRLQTVTITYSATDTETKTEVFRDLELGKSYYVFELGPNGIPVTDGGTLSDRFTVSYQYQKPKLLTADNGEQTVTVTNQVHMPELPEAGGIGTTMFYVAGWILLAGAVVLLLTKKRMSAR